jgi:diaminohydroxyphosphoribosylaminopyrimidine deaminase / 5-amino-6-(5-phosphoribosylamino)uracil reductase
MPGSNPKKRTVFHPLAIPMLTPSRVYSERKMPLNQEDNIPRMSHPGVTAVWPAGAALADAERLGAAARDSWDGVPEAFRAGRALPAPWEMIFGPLRASPADGLTVVGQMGQSLDGRIATVTGHSHYINGPDGLDHLHRLRALVDAVVVGVATAVADNPQLTVRRVAGPNPARVVIDPRGRLPPSARMLGPDGARRLIVTNEATALCALPAGVDVVRLPARDGRLAPCDILAHLAERGFRRIMIEGGALTVSRFLAAGCLDRVHVIIAPLILGAGPTGFALAPVARVDDAIRPPTRAHRLGDEIVFDCDLAAQRVPIGRANTSM